MRYDKRNRTALDNLAPNTKTAAYKWYQFCLDNNIEILITETIRTKEKQAEYVKKGTSQTMRSWHLVGQALDFVPVTSTGGTDYNGYYRPDVQKAIVEAKRLGFKWGGDWKGAWDKPHLEYQYKGYGTDKKLDENTNGEDEEQMNLTQTQKNMLVESLKSLYDRKIISDKSWIEKAEKGTLTNSELTWLNTIVLSRKEGKQS